MIDIRILRLIYYVTAITLILDSIWFMIKNGIDVNHFLIVGGYLSGVLWCHKSGNKK